MSDRPVGEVIPLPSPEEVADMLLNPDNQDIALAVAGVGLGFIPYFGGPLSSAVSERRRHRADRRYFEVIASLCIAVQGIRDKIDEPFVRTTEFADLADATAEEAARARQFAKKDHYVSGLINASLEGHGSIDESLLFMATLDRMQLPHLRLLRVLEGLPSSGKDGRFYAHSGAEERQAIVGGMGDLAPEIVQVLLDELGRFGLADTREVMADDGLVPEDRDHVLTEYGRRFVAFIEAPEHPAWTNAEDASIDHE